MSRTAIVTAVYGDHVDLLPDTLGTYACCASYELHAFVFGGRQPRSPHPRITYHPVAWSGGFGPPYREVNYRRWEVIDAFDHAVVVDGGDTFCLRPLPPIAQILEGKIAAAVVEHLGSRSLGRCHTSTYFNAGVTFWDVAASRTCRRDILERGRIRFRAQTDDQLALNEVLHRDILRVRILPFPFNYHLHLKPRLLDRYWPVSQDMTGVFILHTPDTERVRSLLQAAPDLYPLEPLTPESMPPGSAVRRLRQLGFRWRHRC